MSDPGPRRGEEHPAEGKDNAGAHIDFARFEPEHRSKSRCGTHNGKAQADRTSNWNAEPVNQKRDGKDRAATTSQAE